MNRTNPSPDDKKLADSIVGWWQDAGVDYLVEAVPESWLEDNAEEAPAAMQPNAVAEKPNTQQPAPPSSDNVQELLNMKEWPDSLEKLQQHVKDSVALPGNIYGRQTAHHIGAQNAKCVAILDLPSQNDLDSGQLGSGAEGKLLSNMLKAIGLTPDEVLITALATSRPATGALPEGDYPILAEFIHHQLDLIRPEKIVIFGSATAQALLGAEMMQLRGRLHNFNYKVQKVAALTTFHPRSLLARPQLKAQAWKDLQILLE